MEINSRTELLGLLGKPIAHSLSPRIHNGIFQHDNINAAYLCFELESSSLACAVQGLRHMGVRGFNVTIPYKETVVPMLDELSEEVKLIKAVNTVKNIKGKLVGYNTDGLGFIDSLVHQARFSPAGQEACIVGAGGAARSLGFYLCKERISRLAIYDLVPERAAALAAQLRALFAGIPVQALQRLDDIPATVSLLVNATGVGTKATDAPVLTAAQLRRFRSPLVYDLIYNAALPPLLKEAQSVQFPVMNGLWMLVYQALRALTIWFDNETFLQKGDFCYNLLQGAL